jgi:ABC-type transporter Mla MlaB component
MPWVLERAPGRARLILTGVVDIFEAAPLHAMLVELADESGSVEVDLSGCGDVDGAAVQLLVAFGRAREAGARGVSFTGVSGRVSRLLARLGLDQVLAPGADHVTTRQ